VGIFSKKQSGMPGRRLANRDVSVPSQSDIFRRNRTLSGTTSSLESPRTHVRHLSIQRRKIISILLIVISSAGLLWILVSNFTATAIVNVSSTDISKSIDYSYYGKAIQDYLDINPMSRFHFLLDQSALTAYVSGKFSEVANIVQQNMVNIGETNFAVTMRKPVAGWMINNKQYYVDSKGISFEQNYFSVPAVQIVDNSGVSLQTGTAIASNRFLSFAGRVVALAAASGYTVTQAELPVNTTRELEVRLKESNFLVKLSIDRPVGEQVEDMGRAVQYFINHGQVPAYIDVRVSGKAFYQ
jgi:cell division septal protein FtsQ